LAKNPEETKFIKGSQALAIPVRGRQYFVTSRWLPFPFSRCLLLLQQTSTALQLKAVLFRDQPFSSCSKS